MRELMHPKPQRRILIIAGPTCSGKSALALALAQRLGGVIINADAMQVYRDLRILTARPTEADESLVPHALYGVRPAAEASTAAWWRSAAMAAIARTDRLPILCGGSFMYLDALLHGMAEIPDPGPAARDEARVLLAALGPTALYDRLVQIDPATAARLRPSDGQRIARAFEVVRGTGRGLAAWQADVSPTAAPFVVQAVVLAPDRTVLRHAIAARWEAMLERGAVDELSALRAQDLDPGLPAMRAHGVPELSAWLDGTISLTEAGRRAVLATGQYTKRQATWLRHHSLAPLEDMFTIAARWDGSPQVYSQFMPDMIKLLS